MSTCDSSGSTILGSDVLGVEAEEARRPWPAVCWWMVLRARPTTPAGGRLPQRAVHERQQGGQFVRLQDRALVDGLGVVHRAEGDGG